MSAEDKLILTKDYFFCDSINDDGSVSALCATCKTKVSANLKATSNLLRHLRTKHSEVFTKYNKSLEKLKATKLPAAAKHKRKTDDAFQSVTKFFKLDSSKSAKSRVHELVVNYIGAKMAPLNTVEDDDFKRLCAGLMTV